MIVSHEHRFIFLKTRKTGGTSVEIALSDICGPDDVMTALADDDEALRLLRGKTAQNFGSPPLAVRVGNHAPARRARTAVGPEVWKKYYKFTIERNPWDQVVSQYYWVTRLLDDRATFADFVRSPRVGALAEANAAGYRINGRIVVDRVCRYEQLSGDLDEVWDRLGLPGRPDLPHSKGGVRPSGSYRDLYDDEARDLVGERFADAVRDFGYAF